MLTALLLGAFFCWGNETSAYTYSGKNITIDKITEDENDLTVTGNSNIISSNDINIKRTQKKEIYVPTTWTGAIEVWCITDYESGGHREGKWGSLPANPTDTQINNFNKQQTYVTAKKNKDGTITLYNTETQKELKSRIISSRDQEGWNDDGDIDFFTETIKIQGGTLNESQTKEQITNLGDANITVSGASSLTSKAGVQTTKAINVYSNSKLTAAGAINAESITAYESIITGASITSNQKLTATRGGSISANSFLCHDVYAIDGGSISAINGDLTANLISVGGATVSATGTITAPRIFMEDGKIKARNITTNNLQIIGGATGRGMVDISKGTLTVNCNSNELCIDIIGGTIKAKFLKIKNTTGHTNSIGSATYITGDVTLNGKALTASSGAANTDIINKVQMTTALNNAKPKLGKTYSAGTGINLSTNNAVGLTNAAAYTTADKNRIYLAGTAKTNLAKAKTGKITATSKDLINGSQLYSVQQSIAGFANRIQTNKTQLEALKSSINAKKTELSGIQKNLNTIKGTKLSQDMSNLTIDGEAVIKNQVKKAIQKLQHDMDVSTVSDIKETQAETTKKAIPATKQEAAIMLADLPANSDKPVNKVAANISKEDITVKADLEQTRKNLQNKADVDTMNVAAYTKQLTKGLATGESTYQAIQEAKEDRLVQAKENTLTVGANGTEAKIDASKKNWAGISVNEKEAGSMANVGYVNQELSMESSYDRLSLMKKDLEKDTNKGIAKAAAMAALKPIGNDEEDKVSFAIGYGHYKDGNAAAIGTFFRPSQDILIHLDVTAGAGKPSMNTGVSFKVGKGSSYASMTREELAAENTAMKNQAKKQAERIQTQKEKIEHLESVMQSIRF